MHKTLEYPIDEACQANPPRENAANAGQATLDHATTPLTPKEFKHAKLVALSFNLAPALIVASPFTLAHSTAMANAKAIPRIPFETWPIQEFTYLEPARCTSTTVADRREWVEAYPRRPSAGCRERHLRRPARRVCERGATQ